MFIIYIDIELLLPVSFLSRYFYTTCNIKVHIYIYYFTCAPRQDLLLSAHKMLSPKQLLVLSSMFSRYLRFVIILFTY